MRTPEEIRKALECCGYSSSCKTCAYFDGEGLCIGKKVPKWISPDDELPEEYVSVLGCMGDAGFLSVHECYLTGSGFLFPALGEYRPVKYWACMPEPPKEEHHD